MRIWTNGTRHVLFDETGLHILEEGVTRHIEDFTTADCDPEVFSVSPSGNTIWLKLPSGNAFKLELGDEITVVEYDWEPHAIVAVNDDAVIAIYVEGDETDEPLKLARGTPPQEDFEEWQHRMSLAEPVDGDWPDGLLDKHNPSTSDRMGLGTARDLNPSDLSLATSFFGTAIVDKRAGLVARIPSHGTQVDQVWRVPTSYDGILHAVCTPEGILVTHGFAEDESVLSHYDRHGTTLNRRVFWNLGPVELLDGGRAFSLASPEQGESGLVGRIISLSTMADLRTFDIHFDGYPREIGVFVDRDRRHCLAVGPDYVQYGRLDGNRWVLDSDNFLDRFERAVNEAEFEEPDYVPSEATGDPEVNFPVIEDAPEGWDFDEGGDVSIPIKVRSAGEPGHGVRVWLSGDAIKERLFEPGQARMGETSASFEPDPDADDQFVATIEDAELPQGLEYPLDPKPKKAQRPYANELLDQTHRQIEITGEASEPGDALLRIEVAAVGQPSPIKWMRPFTVDES